MKIILHGATGHMGMIVKRLIEQSNDMEIVACVCNHDVDWCLKSLDEYTGEADCIVDFSHHTTAKALTEYAVKRNIPLLVATTGHTDEEVSMITRAGESVPVFFCANMSPAVALFCEMAAKFARMFPDADIELVEKHHNRKVDVPSGTALMIAHAVENAVEGSSILVGRHENGKRVPRQIGIHSLRVGNEVGSHELIIATGTQTFTMKHEAEDRALFAEGALVAVRYLVNQPAGFYNMQNMLAE